MECALVLEGFRRYKVQGTSFFREVPAECGEVCAEFGEINSAHSASHFANSAGTSLKSSLVK